jgi:hypothetical protein
MRYQAALHPEIKKTYKLAITFGNHFQHKLSGSYVAALRQAQGRLFPADLAGNSRESISRSLLMQAFQTRELTIKYEECFDS